ncbi:MAG: response regulator [Anaerolineae bacterium]|nr:response regulator [Anaerolineae bacterium]
MTDGNKIRVIIVDDIAETRENIRKLLQFDADVEVVGVAETGAEGIKVAVETDPDVVLMDINMPDMDGITATEKIRSRMPSVQVVILSVQSDSNYLRRAMVAGANDFLTKPPDVDELSAAIRRAGEKAHEEKAKVATTMAAVQAGGQATGRLLFPSAYNGKVIVLYSPKGGTGVTTLTANMAVALHSEEKPVVVVDGRLQFGDLSFFFNQPVRNNIADLAPRADELDKEIMDEVLSVHEETGISILAAPPRPEHAEGVSGEQFAKILNFLKSLYSYVLVDTDSGVGDVTLGAVEVADIVAMIVSQDIPSIKNARLFLDLMDALGMPRDNIVLAINKFDRKRNVTEERLADITKQQVLAAIPVDEKLVIPAMDKGHPFIKENKPHPVSKGIIQMARGILAKLEELEKAQLESPI